METFTVNMGNATMIYAIPLLNAAFGWCMISLLFYMLFHPVRKKNFFIVDLQGFVPRNLPQWGQQACAFAVTQLPDFGKLKDNLLEGDRLSKINEILDDKVDDFLRNKLKDKIPVFGMFITEGMISKMKETLMNELDHMIPDLVGFFADDLQKKFNIERMITAKMEQIDAASLEKLFYSHAGKGVLQLKLTAAITGLLLGIVELLLIRNL